MSTTSARGNFAVVGKGSIWEGIAYWAIVIGVYLMVGGLMFYSGKEKLFDDNGHAPESVKKQFADSFRHLFEERRRDPPAAAGLC